MQNRPAIVAVGRTKFGEHYGKEPEKLIEEAWLAASHECDLERRDLEACYLSDFFLPITNKLGLEEGFLSELTELHVPMEVTRSVSAALLTAYHAIQAGVYSTVLVGGIEKMTDRLGKIRDCRRRVIGFRNGKCEAVHTSNDSGRTQARLRRFPF